MWKRQAFDACNQHAGKPIDQYAKNLKTKAQMFGLKILRMVQ